MPITPTGPSLLSPTGAALAPGNEDELRTAVREAAARGQALFIEGNGSKRHHGPAASDRARRLSMRRIGRVTAYDPGDMVVSVQAGTRLVDLQRQLGEHKQWLPIDPPYPNATIGGILATGSAGPRRLGYGTIKDALLGMRVVGASGEITKSGGRVVKNVSGFDLHRLQVGAFGSLGVILEAHFKVTTRPALVGVLLVGLDSFEAAIEALLTVTSSPLRPVALEALDARAAAALRASCPELPEAPGVALIGIEGSRAALDRHLRDLAELRARAGTTAFIEGDAAHRLWEAYRDAPARAGDDITVRIGARPRQLPGLLGALDLPALGASSRICHAGIGTAHVRFGRTGDLAELGARIAACQDQARAVQGYALVESAPVGIAGRELLPWGASGAGAGISKKIKESWDPTLILNPGRIAL